MYDTLLICASGILSALLAFVISRYSIGLRDKLLRTVPKVRLEETRECTMEDTIRILDSFDELEGDITQILEKEYGKTKKNESIREGILQQILMYLLEHDKELDPLIKLAKYKKDQIQIQRSSLPEPVHGTRGQEETEGHSR